MLKNFSGVLRWVLAGAAVFVLPCCLLLQMELHPGTSCLDHLHVAFTLVAGFFLIVRPSTGLGSCRALPEEHVDAFRYAIRSGALPLASLFSDWSGELAHHRFLLNTALRGLPAVTWAVLAMNLYGMLMYAGDHVFFLISALAAAVFSLVAFSRATIALRNVHALENRLRQQQQLLDAPRD